MYKNAISNTLSMVLVAVLLAACASIVGSTSDPISINSIPDGADFVIKTDKGTVMHKGKTPSIVVLEKGEGYFNGYDYSIEISKDGYSSQVVALTTGPGGWYIFGNLLFGGLIGYLIVDPATGAMWTFSKDRVDVHLEQKIDKVGLKLLLLDDVPIHERGQLLRVN